jgi:hypothetical protein
MEALFYLSDLLATVLLMYWAMTNADRPPGTPITGLFAFKDTLTPSGKAAQGKAAAAPGRHGQPGMRPAPGPSQPVPGPGTGGPGPGWRDSGRHNPGWRSAGSREAGSREAGGRDGGRRDPNRRHPGRRDPVR